MVNRILSRQASRCFLLYLLAPMAHAGPMGFEDSWMTMGDIGPNWREVFVNYAFSPRDAAGLSQTYMRADDDNVSGDLTEVTYTRLLKRWNMPEAQANLWFIGGIGDLRYKDHEQDERSNLPAATPGIQADYETTRLYFSALQRLYRASGIDHDYSSVRAGFAFFEPHYESTQPWLIIEARKMNGLSESTE
ncbi:MAG TPA: hypothetical protein VM553_11110, partial [Dongiaceae bacterium]|nr:hypothetical protein [Dongiaceae bacterium]